MVAIVTILVYVLPPGYTASSKILVEPTKSPSLGTETRFATDVGEVLFTEIEIVLSRSVMEAVVDKLQLDKLPGPKGPIGRFIVGVKADLVDMGLLYPPEPREGWIKSLLKDVKVKPVLDTHVFTIKYSHEDPRLAADIVNAITDEYMIRHARIYSYENAVEFFRSNMVRAKTELDRLVTASGRPDGGSSRTSPIGKRDALVASAARLQDRLNDFRYEMTDTLARFAADHPKSVAIREKIAATQAQLSSTQAEIQRLDNSRKLVEGLQPTIEGQEETYRSYKKQYEQALLSAVADNKMINAHIMDHAPVPLAPAYPRLVYVLVSVLAGAFLAVLIALVREYYDHRVQTPEDAERILGIPVIGSVTKQWRLRL